MTISAIDMNSIADNADSLLIRDAIKCGISESEKSHLFHQANFIGKWIRENMVFPLSNIKDPEKRFFLQREDWIATDLFWKAPFTDLRYPRQKEIRDAFNRYDQFVVIESEGKQIKVKCRVIETKGCPKEGSLNHIIVQGNISTLNNNMPGIYPFLDSYLKQKSEHPELPPGRFIIVNHYDNKTSDIGSDVEKDYYPGDLDEWSFVFKKTVESLVNNYGKLQLVAAHSLGNIPVVEYLKHVKDEEFSKLFPRTLFLAQGPSSFGEVIKNTPASFELYPWDWFGVFGYIVYFLAKWTGWNPDLDKTLVQRLNNLPKNSEEISEKLKDSNVIITEVAHDYYFPGKASLCASEKLEELIGTTNLYRMTFNPPLSWGIPRAQHNYNIGLLQRQDLVKEKLYWAGEKVVHLNNPQEIVNSNAENHFTIRHGESLVDAVLRASWVESLHKPRVDLMGRVIPIVSAA